MAAVEAVAELCGVEAVRQEFSLPDDDWGVWEVVHRTESGNVRVLLWPSIARIDVAVGPHLWVVRGVREVEVIEGLEWITRFGADGVLTAALNGQIALTTPS